MAELAVAYDDEGVRIACASCLVVIIWLGSPRREQMEQVTAIQRVIVAEHGYCVSLSIVQDRLSVNVGEGVKEASAENMKEFASTNLGAAVVVEQGGIRATIIRSLITGIQLVAFSPLKQRVFGSTADALGWLGARPGLPKDKSELISGLDPQLQALLRGTG